MKTNEIQEIHESLENGQRKQMVKLINEYGLYDFFADYKDFLENLYGTESVYKYFSDATISYFRITNR